MTDAAAAPEPASALSQDELNRLTDQLIEGLSSVNEERQSVAARLVGPEVLE